MKSPIQWPVLQPGYLIFRSLPYNFSWRKCHYFVEAEFKRWKLLLYYMATKSPKPPNVNLCTLPRQEDMANVKIDHQLNTYIKIFSFLPLKLLLRSISDGEALLRLKRCVCGLLRSVVGHLREAFCEDSR